MTDTASARRVLVPRPADRAASLLAALEARGLEPVHRPFLVLEAEHDSDLRDAVADLAAGCFAALAVTSPRALDALAAYDGAEADRGVAFRVPEGTAVWAVGEGTAEEARAHGLEPALVAAGSGAALVEAVPEAPSGGAEVLLPVSAAARDTVETGLVAKGYRVRRETAYRPRTLPQDPATVAALREGEFAAIVLTSSMIASLASHLGIHRATRVIAIGEPTAATARERGLRVDATAPEPTDEALARTVADALEEQDR